MASLIQQEAGKIERKQKAINAVGQRLAGMDPRQMMMVRQDLINKGQFSEQDAEMLDNVILNTKSKMRDAQMAAAGFNEGGAPAIPPQAEEAPAQDSMPTEQDTGYGTPSEGFIAPSLAQGM